MKRRNAEIHPFPAARVSQNANQNAYQGMKAPRNLQPSPAMTQVSVHLQRAWEALDGLVQQNQDALPPAMAADLNEAVELIFEALQRVDASGLVISDGDQSGTVPQPAANLR